MSTPSHVGVFGGGRMGAGIAHAFLVSGSAVTVIESSSAAAAAATDRVRSSLARADERGQLESPREEMLTRLMVATEPRDLRGSGLVVEAVPEDAALKQHVLGTAEVAAPDAWLATNTSSLSIDRLGVGPVPSGAPDRAALLQSGTRQSTCRGRRWRTDLAGADRDGARLGGRARQNGDHRDRCTWIRLVAARRCPGPRGHAHARGRRRLGRGHRYGDALGYKHAVGPLRTTDLVGLDVRLAVAEHLSSELGERFAPPAILREKVAAGELGRKSGQGFFRWDRGPVAPRRHVPLAGVD